jgi:hypothetical protein
MKAPTSKRLARECLDAAEFLFIVGVYGRALKYCRKCASHLRLAPSKWSIDAMIKHLTKELSNAERDS